MGMTRYNDVGNADGDDDDDDGADEVKLGRNVDNGVEHNEHLGNRVDDLH